jgi:hypothetical protein
MDAGIKPALMDDGIPRIARGVEHAEPRAHVLGLIGEHAAGDGARQDETALSSNTVEGAKFCGFLQLLSSKCLISPRPV